MTPSALVLVGDHPGWPTGLARILRDVARQLTLAFPDVPRYVASFGLTSYRDCEALGFRPVTLSKENWGADSLEAWWREEVGERRGLLFTIWDPARCADLIRQVPAAQKWGYFPIDAENLGGRLTGVAAHVLRQYDRRLAYTRWAAGLIDPPANYLPHGINLGVFRQPVSLTQYAQLRAAWGDTLDDDTILVGCVATNQPRKDLGLWALTIRRLADHYGSRLQAWLHTDQLVKVDSPGWAIPQLLTDAGIADRVLVSTDLTDEQLAARYACSTITLAPGMGEGFGYPIAESLACGTPVIHHTYGGGACLIPRAEWKAPVKAVRLEPPHCLVRPVVDPVDFANAAIRAIDRMLVEGDRLRGLCRLSVRHLGWDVLGSRWQQWLQQGR